ncbi:hypothetical protein [Archaeoglobus sp.]
MKRLLAERGLKAKGSLEIDETNLDEFDLVVTVCGENNCNGTSRTLLARTRGFTEEF